MLHAHTFASQILHNVVNLYLNSTRKLNKAHIISQAWVEIIQKHFIFSVFIRPFDIFLFLQNPKFFLDIFRDFFRIFWNSIASATLHEDERTFI